MTEASFISFDGRFLAGSACPCLHRQRSQSGTLSGVSCESVALGNQRLRPSEQANLLLEVKRAPLVYGSAWAGGRTRSSYEGASFLICVLSEWASW